MKFDSTQLIDDLSARVKRAGATVKKFRALEVEELNRTNDPGRWSILECIEHLNLYGDFYLPEIERSILAEPKGKNRAEFRSGLLGNYFANLMKVAPDGGMKKMKSPKDKNPIGSSLTITTIERFLKQLERLAGLLEQARSIDLARAKTAVSISKLIQLRLGDTFRFFVYHIERHVLQAGGLVVGSEEMAVIW